MKDAQKEIDEFELLEQQLLEASHVSDVPGPLYATVIQRGGRQTQQLSSIECQHIRSSHSASTRVNGAHEHSEDSDDGHGIGLDDRCDSNGHYPEEPGHRNDTTGAPNGRYGTSEDADEEELSLRHLRKSWTGMPASAGNVAVRESHVAQAAPVDDSRSWGDVTNPPADLGMLLRSLSIPSER